MNGMSHDLVANSPTRLAAESVAIPRAGQCCGNVAPGRNQVAFAACVLLNNLRLPCSAASAAVRGNQSWPGPCLAGLLGKRRIRGKAVFKAPEISSHYSRVSTADPALIVG